MLYSFRIKRLILYVGVVVSLVGRSRVGRAVVVGRFAVDVGSDDGSESENNDGDLTVNIYVSFCKDI